MKVLQILSLSISKTFKKLFYLKKRELITMPFKKHLFILQKHIGFLISKQKDILCDICFLVQCMKANECI